MLVFRQLLDPVSSTYSYLLGDSAAGEAVLVDPVYEHESRDLALLRELGLRLIATLDTHVHADHVTGAWVLKQRCGSRILMSAAAAAAHVDRPLNHGDRVAFGERWLDVRATPGHTSGCLTYVLDDMRMAFTGDSLLIRGCGRTDFQQGSAAKLFSSVKEQIFSLPGECLVYPAHDYRGITVTTVAEERQFNPRLGGDVDVRDFCGYMNHLGLAHPKLIDIAVPANLVCGRPDNDVAAPNQDWAPVTMAFSGIWEIQPSVLAELIGNGQHDDLQIVDVREPEELAEPLGHIPGASSLSLSSLPARCIELDRNRPVVAVCRSGARSAQATVLLRQAGFSKVANLAGGMLRWHTQGLMPHSHQAPAASSQPAQAATRT